MATYRPIHTRIWKDPDFEKFNYTQKLIFVYLLTNESTTESGIYPITTKTISNETGVPIKRVEELLVNGFKNISFDPENSCIFVKKFLKYNGGGRPDLLIKSVEKDYKNIKTNLWKEFVLEYPEYLNILQTVDKPLVNSSNKLATISNSISITNSNTNSIKNYCPDLSGGKSEPDIIDDFFEESKEPEAKPEKPKKPKDVKLKISKINLNRSTWEFEGITEQDIDLWCEAYPAVVLDVEIKKAIAWVQGAGSKGYKSNWRKFLTGWFDRCQNSGGTKNVSNRT